MPLQVESLPTTEAEATYYSDELLKCGGHWDAEHLAYFLFNYAFTKDEREGTIKLFPDYPFICKKLIPNFFNLQGTDYLKSRQMLVSWFFAGAFVWECNFFDAWTDIFRSQGLKEAQELKIRSQFIYDHLPAWMQGELQYENTTEMVWKHRHTRIISVHSGRSFTGHRVLVDEAAHIPEGAKVNEELGPTADAKGIVDKVTTPNGQDELFHSSWHNEKDGRNKVKLHWSEHPNRDQAWREETQRKLNLTDEQWNREYELSFETQGGIPVLQGFERVRHVSKEPLNPIKDRPILKGIDLGYECPVVTHFQVDLLDRIIVLCSNALSKLYTRDLALWIIKFEQGLWGSSYDLMGIDIEGIAKSANAQLTEAQILGSPEFGFTVKYRKSDLAERHAFLRHLLATDRLIFNCVGCDGLISAVQSGYCLKDNPKNGDDVKDPNRPYKDYVDSLWYGIINLAGISLVQTQDKQIQATVRGKAKEASYQNPAGYKLARI